MEPFLELLDGIEHTVMAEHKLTDVVLTVKADADFFMTSIEFTYVFEETAKAATRVPEIAVKTVYTGWNDTVLEEPYDLSDFTEIEDIRLIETFTDALSDRKTAERGRFTATTHSNVRVVGGTAEDSEYTQEVEFENRNGYEFTLNYAMDGYAYDMSYANGSMRVVVRDEETGERLQSQTVEMTDSEAQSTVSQLMDPESISTVDIVDAVVQNAEKGTYRFTLGDAVESYVTELYEYEIGGTAKDFNGYIDAVIVDGTLIEYEYGIFIALRVGVVTVYVNVDVTVTFQELVDSGTSM